MQKNKKIVCNILILMILIYYVLGVFINNNIYDDQYDEEPDKAKEGLQSKKDSTPTEQT